MRNSEAHHTGRWIVARHLDATELSAAPATLKGYLGKTLVVSAKSVAFADESCTIETSRAIATDAAARTFFLRDYKADYAVLDLAAPILVNQSDCNVVVRDSRGRVIFDWDGDFFAVKAARGRHR